MMNKFIDVLDETKNRALTENGAIVYDHSNSALVDCNFAVSGWRYADETEIIEKFTKAYKENKEAALTWLFFLRDCRGGLGERRAFRVIFKYLLKNELDPTIPMLASFIHYYGRYDDVVDIAYDVYKNSENNRSVMKNMFIVLNTLRAQFFQDIDRMDAGLPISLLAKWLPSGNASSKETRAKANMICDHFMLNPVQYRKLLSKMRKYLEIPERAMSANEWESINYEKVPAKAALKYADAFLRHDNDRRRAYLRAVTLGKAKANVNGIDPYEILSKAVNASYSCDEELAEFYESLWDKLVEEGFPNTDAFDGCLPIVDTSGSMGVNVTKKVTARDIAFSLGLYFSQKAKGPFHNRMMSFSEYPEWIIVDDNMSLTDKYNTVRQGPWGMNTDIEAVFMTLLELAVNYNIPAEDMPKSLMIVSDMQFDACMRFGYRNLNHRDSMLLNTLFNDIRNRYHEKGYKMPKLIFWSVTASTKEGIPEINEGDNGLVLISGYSQNAAKAAMNDKTDPLEALMEVLNSDRYKMVREAIANVNATR